MSMGADARTPLVIPVDCAPKKAHSPKCGKKGRRKRIRARTVRIGAYKAVALLEITYGEYAACCRLLHDLPNHPRGRAPKAHYDNRVRQLELDRILQDGISIARARASLCREFLPDLSTGFGADVLRDHATILERATHTAARFWNTSAAPSASMNCT
jgi:hypothetical protein